MSGIRESLPQNEAPVHVAIVRGDNAVGDHLLALQPMSEMLFAQLVFTLTSTANVAMDAKHCHARRQCTVEKRRYSIAIDRLASKTCSRATALDCHCSPPSTITVMSSGKRKPTALIKRCKRTSSETFAGCGT